MFFQTCRTGCALHDAIDHTVAEAPELDAAVAFHWMEHGACALMFDLGCPKPCSNGSDRACLGILVGLDHRCPRPSLLIRLQAVVGHPQQTVIKNKVTDIECDDF